MYLDINPRRACASRVTVVVSCVCVCLSVCLSVCMSVRTRYLWQYIRVIKRITKDTIVLSVTFAAILKWRFSQNVYSKVIYSVFYLPRQGWPSLVDAYSACNVSYTLRYMFAYALRLIIISD